MEVYTYIHYCVKHFKNKRNYRIYVIIFLMKPSAYAEKLGISCKTAWRWWKEGKLDAYQTETGTVIVREQIDAPAGIALYARVSSADQKDDLARQVADFIAVIPSVSARLCGR